MVRRIVEALQRRRVAPKLATYCRLPLRIATSSSRVLPSFLILGVQKGGTTSLLAYLNEHPSVLAPLVKEPHFFDFRFEYGLSVYRACFPRKAELESARSAPHTAAHCGEASPYYIYDPRVPRRVKEVLPEVKLILLLRNPMERAFSHYRHNKRVGHERRAFPEAVEEELTLGPRQCLARRRAIGGSPDHRHFSYLTRGLYLEQIRDWHALFPRGQMLILRSEDFFHHTAAEFAKVLSFLGLDRWQPEAGFRPYNVGPREPLEDCVAERLADFYRDANRQLYDYLQADRPWWPERRPSPTATR